MRSLLGLDDDLTVCNSWLVQLLAKSRQAMLQQIPEALCTANRMQHYH